MINQYTKALSIMLICLAGAGMSPMPEAPENQPVTQPVNKAAKYSTHTVKPHAPIDLDYQFSQPLALGVSQPLLVVIKTGFEVEALLLNLHYDTQGLLIDAPVHYEYQRTQRTQLSLPITGLQAGRYIIEVNALYQHQGEQQARSFAIPITVGEMNKAETTQTQPKTADSPESADAVFRLPAIETSN